MFHTKKNAEKFSLGYGRFSMPINTPEVCTGQIFHVRIRPGSSRSKDKNLTQTRSSQKEKLKFWVKPGPVRPDQTQNTKLWPGPGPDIFFPISAVILKPVHSVAFTFLLIIFFRHFIKTTDLILTAFRYYFAFYI